MVEISPGHFVRPQNDEWVPQRKARLPVRNYEKPRREVRELELG